MINTPIDTGQFILRQQKRGVTRIFSGIGDGINPWAGHAGPWIWILGAYKALWLFIVMTFDAVFLCLFRGHLPDMRLMAVTTLEVHLHMEFMLARLRNRGVAACRAIRPVRPCLPVRVMTGPAFKLHGGICRNLDLDRLFDRLFRRPEMFDINCTVGYQLISDLIISMAEEAFLSAGKQVHGAVRMTVKTGQLTHRHTDSPLIRGPVQLEILVLVAGQTIPLLHGEFVGLIAMALGAFYLLVKDMLRMIPRPADIRRLGKFLIPLPVTPQA
jgi:hypothetical protein